MSATRILGIDPGLSGACVLLDMCESEVIVFDIPVIERRVNGSVKKQIDPYALGQWVDVYRNTIKLAVVEQVNAMPKQGVTSSFNFGFTTGAIHGALAGNAVPMVTVPPSVWKRDFGLLGQDKDASRLAASRIVPKFACHWPLKKHDGRAEAFLLAVYGSRLPVAA